MNEIITITTVPSIGDFATVRAIRAEELTFQLLGTEGGRISEFVRGTVVIPGVEKLGRHGWNDSATVEFFIPLLTKVSGTANRAERNKAAIVATVGGWIGDPVRANAVLAALDKAVAERARNFNAGFQRRAEDLAGKADALWKEDTFAIEKASIAALTEAKQAVAKLLNAARDDLHAKGKAKLVEYLRERVVDGVIDFDAVADTNRAFNGMFD
jgi:hypothetical protein